MRIGAHHGFALKLENKPQHAVRRRMLGAEVDGEVAILAHDSPLSTVGAICQWSVRTTRATVTRGSVSTGSYSTLPFCSSQRTVTFPISGKSLRNGWPIKP